MRPTEPAAASERPLAQDFAYAIRYYLGGRRGLIIGGVAIAAAALFLKWDWLVAVGFAPILIAMLPCAAMCALGLCMNRGAGESCDKEAAPRETTVDSTDDVRPTAPASDTRIARAAEDVEAVAAADIPTDPESSKERRTIDA